MKTPIRMIDTVASLVVLVWAGAALAQNHGQSVEHQTRLPAAYVVHKLAADGIALRALETEDGMYRARVDAGDGTVVTVGIDPYTADLTDDFNTAHPHRSKGTGPNVSAADAIVAVADAGHWDVREVEYEKGRWEVKAADDQGQVEDFVVDAATGKLR